MNRASQEGDHPSDDRYVLICTVANSLLLENNKKGALLQPLLIMNNALLI